MKRDHREEGYNSFIVSEYLDEHKEVLLRDNVGRNKSLLVNEHMRKFIGWLWYQISQSDTKSYLGGLNRQYS
jgi:hypothetical protein